MLTDMQSYIPHRGETVILRGFLKKIYSGLNRSIELFAHRQRGRFDSGQKKEVKMPFSFLFMSLSSGRLTRELMPGERCPHASLEHHSHADGATVMVSVPIQISSFTFATFTLTL